MSTSLESLVSTLKRSGLIDDGALKRHLGTFRESELPHTGEALAEYLVSRQAITGWQGAKLLLGKHKGFFLGKYKLLQLLGRGGMSSVYLAEHVVMRRRSAIKVLPWKLVKEASYVDRFHREAQAVAALDHPNIVRAYDVDHERDGNLDIHFLVMEFVDGSNLFDLVQNSGPLSPVRAAEYIRQGGLGLEHAHRAGMVHRDIKPGNFLVDQNGVVKLMDLGLARVIQEGEALSLTMQYEEKVLGTADYLAPEQAVDSHSVDRRADIYSLGCTFYFLLTGRPPFIEGSITQRLLDHQLKEPTPLEQLRPDLPESLLAIVRRMMAKNRDERIQTASDVVTELTAWLSQHGGDEWDEMSIQAGATGVFPITESARYRLGLGGMTVTESGIFRTLTMPREFEQSVTPASDTEALRGEQPSTSPGAGRSLDEAAEDWLEGDLADQIEKESSFILVSDKEKLRQRRRRQWLIGSAVAVGLIAGLFAVLWSVGW